MAILVSGASGFLGNKLLERLLLMKKEIIAVDLSIPDDVISNNPKIKWILSDIAKDGIGKNQLPKLEAVIHLAGATLGAGSNESLFIEANEFTTVRLMQATANHCDKFILASSQVVYGDVNNLSVTEEFPLSPNGSAYACSKVNAENWMRWFYQRYGGTHIMLRLCGFLEGKGIVDYLIDCAINGEVIKLFSKGEIYRDYLPSSNGIDAIIGALNYDRKNNFLPVNIGSGQSLSASELALIICKELDSNSEIVYLDEPGPQGNFIFSIDKARELLDFTPDNLIESVKLYARTRKQESLGSDDE
jgi:nucleoside-diphosphate-sugar epimerase